MSAPDILEKIYNAAREHNNDKLLAALLESEDPKIQSEDMKGSKERMLSRCLTRAVQKPLVHIGQKQQIKTVQLLLAYGANIEGHAPEVYTPLHLTSNLKIQELLILNGAKIDAVEASVE